MISKISSADDEKECTIFFNANCPSYVVNGLRRTLMMNLVSKAVKSVIVHKNTSVFPCELLAHRLSMLPFFDENDVCFLHATSNGCIYSDLILNEKNEKATASGIYLFTLSESQEVKMTIKLARGCGEEHAKFSHVSQVAVSKISESNTQNEPECLCGHRFEKKEYGTCARCNFKKYEGKKRLVLSFKSINEKRTAVSYFQSAVDCFISKIEKVERGMNDLKTTS